MQKTLEDVDSMVVSLKAAVSMVLEREDVLRCEISVAEALTNIVAHAIPKTAEAYIDLIVTEVPQAVVIEIFDPAGADAFDPRDHVTVLQPVDPMAESGRGLGLILKCADVVRYGPVDGRNRLSLAFLKTGGNQSRPEKPIAMQSGENS
ncbi:ATP-binding protein [Yoonia algicola]|uniref:ATP-binding protein n=1 Tax=Yoonia algicola TaxID=3137368 RepID=A0AAN0NGB2_9RHOB